MDTQRILTQFPGDEDLFADALAMPTAERRPKAESYLVNSYRTVSSGQHADPRTQEVVRNRIVRFYTERGQTDKLLVLTAAADP